MMKGIGFTALCFVYTIIILFAGLFIIGCGGGSNPVGEQEASSVDGLKSLKVDVEVSSQTVRAAEQVRFTAKVRSVPQGSKILYTWSIVEGKGEFGDEVRQSTVTWTAPSVVDTGEIQLSIIQLTVTVISQQFSGDGSNVKIEKEVRSFTRTVPITVIGT